jgi:hypothetical protein
VSAHNETDVQSDAIEDARLYRWHISPHPYSSDFDVMVTNSDKDALAAGFLAVENALDDLEVGEERTITIKRNAK